MISKLNKLMRYNYSVMYKQMLRLIVLKYNVVPFPKSLINHIAKNISTIEKIGPTHQRKIEVI